MEIWQQIMELLDSRQLKDYRQQIHIAEENGAVDLANDIAKETANYLSSEIMKIHFN